MAQYAPSLVVGAGQRTRTGCHAAPDSPSAALPEEQRADAALYLQESLGLHADEGAHALARYWLPAQAHHLNQLAADAVHGVLPPRKAGLVSRPRKSLSSATRLKG